MKKALPLAVCMLPGPASFAAAELLFAYRRDAPEGYGKECRKNHPDCLRRISRRFRDGLTRGGKNDAQR